MINALKWVRYSKTGKDKATFTVVLAYMADGTKFKPTIICKQKTFSKIIFLLHVFVHFHEKEWDGVKLRIINVRNKQLVLFTKL